MTDTGFVAPVVRKPHPQGDRTRRWGGNRAIRLVPPLLVAVGVLALWELTIVVFQIEEFLLPRPTTILSTLFAELGVILRAAAFTLRSVLGGLLLGAGAAFLVALATARFSFVTEASVPLAAAINSTPIVALAPIANQWFGITDPLSKIFVVAVIVFFPVMINVTKGLISVDPSQLELLRSYAASPRQVVFKVRLPNAMPYLFNGLKVAASLAVIAAVVAEYFGGPRQALGVYISQQASLFHFAEAWAAIAVASAVGLALFGVVSLAERLVMLVLPWQVTSREAQ